MAIRYNDTIGDSDVRQIIRLFIKNYRIFVACLLIATGLAFLINQFKLPIYKVSSSLLIKEEPQPRGGGNITEFLNSSLLGINRNFQNELWVLKSVPVIEKTISNLNLTVGYLQKKGYQYRDAYDNAPFRILLIQDHVQPVNVRIKISIQDNENFELAANGRNVSFENINTGEQKYLKKKWNLTKKGKFGNIVESPDFAFIVYLKDDTEINSKGNESYCFELTNVIALTNEIKKQLSFRVIDKMATVIEITFKCPSVKKGKDILNEIMHVYSAQNLEQKNNSAKVTITYIEQQLDEISDSLNYTEDKLQRFRSSNQLLNVSEQATSITEQYMKLQNLLAELVSNKRYYDYVADYLSTNDDFSNMIVPASMGISDQLLNNLMTDLISAQTQRSNLIRNNQELNPMVQKLTIQIENTKKTISENISAIRKTTDLSIDEMNKRIEKVEASISRLPLTQRQLGHIERKYRLNDAIYNYLLEKRAEAKIAMASSMPNNLIIEPAQMAGSRPVSPNKNINYLIALFLGIAVPFSFLSLKNALNNKVDTQESIEKLTDIPVWGRIMHANTKTPNIVTRFPQSISAESFRSLRTTIEYQFKKLQPKVILITSCMGGEGKSFNSLNLALSYAKIGQRTLLINTDLRKPTSYFTNEETLGAGLSSWYQESISISEIIQRSPYENLDYIPSGPIPSDPFSLLTQGKTKTLIEKLKILYECIILDTSPLGIVSDTFLLTDYADILILIVRYNYTHINVFSQTIKELKQRRIKRVGIVMNDNRINGDQYGYGYKYGYGYNHQNKRFDLLENFKTIGDRFMKTIFRGNHKSVKNDPQTEAFPGVADR